MAALEHTMKTHFLKAIAGACATLSIWCFLLSNSAVAEPPTYQPTAPARLMLSLPYHGEASAPPRSVSLFWGESDLYIGEMLCSDEARNIYIYDQFGNKRCQIKKFNAQGQLLQTWLVDLHGLGNGVSATVSPNGTVWLNLGVGTLAGEKSGLPLVVLQPGSSKPIADWQQSPPEAVIKLIYNSVTPEVWQSMLPQIKSQTRTWVITRLSGIGNNVLFDIVNLGGGPTYYPPEAKITPSQKLSWQLLFSGDGKTMLQAKSITEREARTRTVFRSSDGALWHSEWDSLNTRPQNWTKMWVWKDGQTKGEPLVTRADLAQPRESWHKLVGTQPERPPTVIVDSKSNIYLIWQRKATSPDRQFTIGKNSWSREPLGEDDGQKAVVVLDSQRKFVASVPWTTCYYELDDWVTPAPNGDGFYREEFSEESLNVYWHPLPNFEAPSKPTKAQ